MILWHPDAERRPVFGRPGKHWDGGQGNPKYLFHTTEIINRWPRYTTPPHLTLNPWTGELRQHVAFNLAAYAVRSGRVDKMQFVYQVEHWGQAKMVPFYPDVWYENVAKLIQWFHDNLDVPIVFDDFTNLRYGPFGSRLPYADVDNFGGIIGHGRVGRGIDSHWDPGALDVPRLEAMLNTPTPPPPPSIMEIHMAYADTLDLADWVATLRPEDIDQLFDLGVHSPDTPAGRAHWKGLLSDPGNSAWEGFRRTTSARIGFWQPENVGTASAPSSYTITTSGDITPT